MLTQRRKGAASKTPRAPREKEANSPALSWCPSCPLCFLARTPPCTFCGRFFPPESSRLANKSRVCSTDNKEVAQPSLIDLHPSVSSVPFQSLVEAVASVGARQHNRAQLKRDLRS